MNKVFNNIRRSPYQALSAIFIISVTMFMVGIFTLISVTSQIILLNFETKPQIIAYLKDGNTQEDISSLLSNLSSTEGVKKAIFVSKEEALEIYKKSVGDDPILLGTITDWGIITADILPASVEVTANSPEFFKDIASVLERSEIISTTPQGKKEIDYPQDIISELTKWTSGIRTAGLLLVTALSLVSILTIIIIISMKISSRRSEIGTLKLIGAKNLFIVKPFIIESIVYGLSGSFIGWLLCFITILYSTPFLSSRLSGIVPMPIPFIYMASLLASMLFFGFLISTIASTIATARFIKRSK